MKKETIKKIIRTQIIIEQLLSLDTTLETMTTALYFEGINNIALSELQEAREHLDKAYQICEREVKKL